MSKSITFAAAAVAAVGMVFAGTAPASAAGAPAKVVMPAAYNNACGAGYSVIDTLTPTGGHVYLTLNASNGYNCVATVRNTSGAPIFMDAWIQRSDGSGHDENDGNFKTYAGPVYVYAPHTCIDWGGVIGTSAVLQGHLHCD
ncbi:spore-associated protein A [Streptomyces sp. NBC_01190]|uniref:spore-associated protein A n=1 Tax=Streptomyces sp. NBC_01190 TaxID=2903767 RepID=UPI00386FC5A1|nr:spore-associated protein A [Streptomyces sp. NBC_01190]